MLVRKMVTMDDCKYIDVVNALLDCSELNSMDLFLDSAELKGNSFSSSEPVHKVFSGWRRLARGQDQ